MTRFKSLFRAFADDQRGSMAIELVMVVPIIVWAMLSTLVYFDAFRNEAMSKRAGLTIADMVSREQNTVDPTFINGAYELLRALTNTGTDPDMRITVYSYDDPSQTYRVEWSEPKGSMIRLTTADLANLKAAGRLPILAHDDRAILVETNTYYSAPFSVGLGPFASIDLDDVTFRTFTVIRPRFTPTVCFDQDLSSPGGEFC